MSEGVPKSYMDDARRFMHRRKSVNIGHPAIIIHRSYRKPPGENDDLWTYATHEFACIVRRKLDNLREGRPSDDVTEPHLPQTERLAIFRRSSQNIRCELGDVKIAFTSDIFPEFWTSKLIIDFSRTEMGASVPTPFDSLLSALNSVEHINNVRFNRTADQLAQDRLREKDVPLPKVNSEVLDLSDKISEAISKIERATLPHTIVKIKDTTNNTSVACNDEKSIFADFIGFSLACPAEKEGQQLALTLKDHHTTFPRQQEHNVLDNIRPHDTVPEDREALMHLVDAIWPVVLELNPYRSSVGRFTTENKTKSPSREFTISGLNRNRGLYVTSLGAVEGLPHQGRTYPLSYLLLCPHRATWQIGRMIDRIHALGVFRLASLFDHDAIDDANDAMRVLIDRLEGDDDSDAIKEDFNRLRVKIEGGLHYRTEWSRYYLKLFHSILNGTKFERVEGYQTYQEFVLRRMGSYFEAIESTSRRFEYLYRLLAEKANERISNSSRKLLQFAEMISVFPVAYYSYDIFLRINERVIAQVGIWISRSVADLWLAFVVVYAVVVGRHLRDFVGPKIRRWRTRAQRY